MFCKKCGKQIDDDTIFCPTCGSKQSVSAVATQNTTTIVQNQNSSDVQELIRQADIAYLEQLRLSEYGYAKLSENINELDNQINGLGIANDYPEPVYTQLSNASVGLPLFGIIISLLALTKIIGVAVDDGYVSDIVPFTLLNGIFIGILVVSLCSMISAKNSNNKKDVQITENNKIALMEYEQTKRNDELRVENELKEKAELTALRQKIYNELEKAYEIKTALYNFNIIPKPFREIPNSVYYLYDYISSSRENLTSAFGHLHLEQIVINQQALMRQNQEILSSLNDLWSSIQNSIEQNNNRFDNIISGLKSTNQNLHQIQQNEEIKQKSLENIKFYARANFWKDILK